MLATLGKNLVKSATDTAQNVANNAVGELQNVANNAVQNGANNAAGAAGNLLNGAAGNLLNGAAGNLLNGAAGTIANNAAGAAGNLLNGAAGTIANNALSSSVTSAIPGIDQNLAAGAMGSLASGAIGQGIASVPAQEPPPPTNDPSSLSQVLKSAIVQLLNTLNEDTEFKRMIADQATNTVYSAIDEKCGKVQQIISNLQNLQADFEKNGSVDYETLKEAVAKYNQGFNLILEGQKRITGGSKRRRQITRRKSSSRAFRKTRGRRQSSR